MSKAISTKALNEGNVTFPTHRIIRRFMNLSLVLLVTLLGEIDA
jgi:hypothetical protein